MLRGGANAKSMCAVLADQEKHRFLIATNSFKKQNEIHIINYSEEANRIDQEQVFTHDFGEIWSMTSSPYNQNQFACGIQTIKDNQHLVRIYNMGEKEESLSQRKVDKDIDKQNQLQIKAEFKTQEHQSNIHSICWEDTEAAEGMTAKEIVTADSQKIVVWDTKNQQSKSIIECSSFLQNSVLYKDQESLFECTVVKRYPHNKNIICVGCEKSFFQIDLRAPIQPLEAMSIHEAHSDLIMDLDYNPNKLNTLVTCGQDSALRFWDMRKSDKCLLQFEEDQHWISKVKYNRSHDQLLLTGSTSTFVSLYRASSVSQMPLNQNLADLNSTNTFMMTSMTMGEGYGGETERMMMQTQRGEGDERQDLIIQKYELEDSVYAIDWSAADAWVFAGISYNGTFFLNLVPSKEKYKILI